ncbi:cytochrome P450 [Lindgomyces ingoldianus]|uniref:Cytochrome P450 n=1 Tax=Lindgomyces ingoldianus TaxID=673940 RepID=A0ACB6QEI9_9PLEO|nr:cytochrome P450 [Lindgomyces ingoldianus]KAF2465311.1 cytochrome P450 [Lindgomyces ingoldianus]
MSVGQLIGWGLLAALWACSRLPAQVSSLSGRSHLRMLELHKQYGPVVRIGPNRLTFFPGQSLKDIYNRTGPRSFKKNRPYYMPPPNNVDHLVGEGLKTQEALVTQYVDAFIQGLSAASQKGLVEISAWFNYTTFDITGDLMFGDSFGCLRNNKLHPWIQLMFSAIKALVFLGVVKQFPTLDWLLMKLVPKSILQKGVDHFNLSAEKVDMRIAMGNEKNDLMSGMLKNGLSEKHGQHRGIMSRAEIHSNSYILIIAGSETSATALSEITYYLCKYPAIRQRLVAEVRSQSSDLPFLHAVIQEGLRIYPPFVGTLSRLPPPGGEAVDGYFVPEGVSALVQILDPRFLKDKLDAVEPFSTGPRGCLGKILAYAEIRLILAKLLFHFDISPGPEGDGWIDQDVYYLWAKPPLMIYMIKRETTAT